MQKVYGRQLGAALDAAGAKVTAHGILLAVAAWCEEEANDIDPLPGDEYWRGAKEEYQRVAELCRAQAALLKERDDG